MRKKEKKNSRGPCLNGLVNIFSSQPKIITGDLRCSADQEACLPPILRLVMD